MQHAPSVPVPQEFPGAEDVDLAHAATMPMEARDTRDASSMVPGAATRSIATSASPLSSMYINFRIV
jgi:hypothetical protein